jgi:hypothetical protein
LVSLVQSLNEASPNPVPSLIRTKESGM